MATKKERKKNQQRAAAQIAAACRAALNKCEEKRPPVTHCMIFHQTRRRSRPPGRRSMLGGHNGRSCMQTGRPGRAGLKRWRGAKLFGKIYTLKLRETFLTTAASAGRSPETLPPPQLLLDPSIGWRGSRRGHTDTPYKVLRDI